MTALVATIAACAGCTTIGAHTQERGKVDYGPAQGLEVCLLKSEDVPPERVEELVAAVNQEFGPYAITVSVPWVHPWQRPSFTASGIMEDVMVRDLEPPCDRLVALVDRHAGDFVWGLLLPEILGEVDDITRTRGFVVATWGSINQVFMEPSAATVHEFYHLVGCGHGVSKSKCYHEIAAMKAARPPDSDFMPGLTKDHEYLLTVDAANEALRKYRAEQDARRQGKSPDRSP